MFDQLLPVFKSLNSHDVKYLVIGGMAAISYGSMRATFDLDVLIEATETNAQRLLDALLAINLGTAALITPQRLLLKDITVFKDRMRIDVQIRTPGIAFEQAWPRRQVMTAKGVTFNVLSKEDLLASKHAAGRKKDLDDIEFLTADDDGDGDGTKNPE